MASSKRPRSRGLAVVRNEPFKWDRAHSENNLVLWRRVDPVGEEPEQPAGECPLYQATAEEYPEVAAIPQTAAALIGLVVLFLAFKLACPKIAAIAPGHRPRGDGPAAVSSGDGAGGVCDPRLRVHPLQHVRRRREDAQAFRRDAHQDPGDHRGRLDRQRVDFERDRRAHGDDGALQADRPAPIHPRQIPRCHAPGRPDVSVSRRCSYSPFRTRSSTTPAKGRSSSRSGRPVFSR